MALRAPGRGLILEILEELLHLGQRRSPHGQLEPMRSLLAQRGVGRQPDGIVVPRLFQPLIDRVDCVVGIGPKEPAAKVAFCVAGYDGVENISLAIGAVDLATAQGAALQHAEQVEQKVEVYQVQSTCPFQAAPPGKHGSG